MSKIIDITDKLNFDEKPSIRIKDTVIEVNDDAPSILKVFAILNDDKGVQPTDIEKITELLFEPEELEKFNGLGLNIRDYSTAVMQIAVAATSNFDDNEGEAPTPATT